MLKLQALNVEVTSRMTRALVLDAERFLADTLGSAAGVEYVSVGRGLP